MASGSMVWVSRWAEAKQIKTTQCSLVLCPCLPLQLLFSAFVMLNATSMGGSVAEVWVTDGGNVVAETAPADTEDRKAEGEKKELQLREID